MEKDRTGSRVLITGRREEEKQTSEKEAATPAHQLIMNDQQNKFITFQPGEVGFGHNISTLNKMIW